MDGSWQEAERERGGLMNLQHSWASPSYVKDLRFF